MKSNHNHLENLSRSKNHMKNRNDNHLEIIVLIYTVH